MISKIYQINKKKAGIEMNENRKQYEEKILHARSGLGVLILDLVLIAAMIALMIFSIINLDGAGVNWLGLTGLIISGLYLCAASWIILLGVKVLRPNEALVLTLFGTYHGTLIGEGIFFVNPFCVAANPGAESPKVRAPEVTMEDVRQAKNVSGTKARSEKLSLKTMTLNNEKQKVNDLLGNPIIIGIAVIWRIENTAKAVFNVDNYQEFLSIQCDAALRNIVRLYPYDVSEEGDEKSLRGSAQEIAAMLREEIQQRVAEAGLCIEEARITHLAYAPEIAAVMLQRQQAAAVIDARKMIVEGAVGMVEMALDQLSAHEVVELDAERRAQMVSNLLVVLCGNRDAQPVVNSGSIY